MMKSVKNPVEIENVKKIHRWIPLAVTKFMIYMKQTVRKWK